MHQFGVVTALMLTFGAQHESQLVQATVTVLSLKLQAFNMAQLATNSVSMISTSPMVNAKTQLTSTVYARSRVATHADLL